MKAALVVLLFGVVSACAQEPFTIAAAEAACGPKEAQFDAQPASTQMLTTQPMTQPEAGKSLVYVVEVFEKAMNQFLSFKPEKLRKSAKDKLPTRVEIYRDGRRLRG